MDPLLLLCFNASLQIFVSCLLGVAMLIPLQPWARGLARGFDYKSVGHAHLDWLMLAFMQFGAAFVMKEWPPVRDISTAWLLVFGGWMNATPYLFRAFGVNAFVLAGDWRQILATSLAGLSSAAVVVAWFKILSVLWPLL